MNKNFTISTVVQIDDVASKLSEIIANESIDCVAFFGSMGVGKTTLIKAICKNSGVDVVVNSPSFTIVNEYVTNRNKTIYHFDMYRIETIEEAYDIGFEEYLSEKSLCLIEWAERIEAILPEDCLRVEITLMPDNSRKIVLI